MTPRLSPQRLVFAGVGALLLVVAVCGAFLAQRDSASAPVTRCNGSAALCDLRLDEVALIEELAERTWSTVTRAQAEAERRNAELALQRSRELLHQTEKLSALGALLAGVSHELNNPLSIVVAQAVMLELQARGTEFGERASKIRRAADRCAKIVQT